MSIEYGDVITLSYDDVAGDMTDTAGLPLASFTDRPVVNNVLLPVPVFSGPVADYNLMINEAGSHDYSVYFTGVIDSYALSAPIPGMTMNPTTGVLSGTPTAEADYPRTVQATNISGTTATNLHTISVISIVMLLDATFHRYGPAGPLVLSDGDIIDDTGTAAAQIDKGAIYIDDRNAIGLATLENETLHCMNDAGGTDMYFRDMGRYSYQAGLTAEFIEAQPDLATPQSSANNVGFTNRAENTLDPLQSYTLNINGQGGIGVVIRNEAATTYIVNIYLLPISAIGPDPHVYTVIIGGYNASGEPDPAGAYGSMYFFDGGIIFSSSYTANIANQLGAYGKGYRSTDTVYESMKCYVDPAPLATPHRSLFATDHADIADYVPEDGAAWVVYAQNMPSNPAVSGGKCVATASGNQVSRLVCGDGSNYAEIFTPDSSGRTIGVLIRHGVGGHFRCRINNNLLQIYENDTQRASLTSGIITEDRIIGHVIGDVVTAISSQDSTVQTYTSTSLQSNTGVGMTLGKSSAGTVEASWFCTR